MAKKKRAEVGGAAAETTPQSGLELLRAAIRGHGPGYVYTWQGLVFCLYLTLTSAAKLLVLGTIGYVGVRWAAVLYAAWFGPG